MWSVPPSNVSHVSREEPLQPRRVPSVFVNNTDNTAQPMEANEVEGPAHEDVKKARNYSFYYRMYCRDGRGRSQVISRYGAMELGS